MEREIAGSHIDSGPHHTCLEHIREDLDVLACWSNGSNDLGACECRIVVFVAEAVVEVAALQKCRLFVSRCEQIN